MTVTLDPVLARFVDDQIKSGKYRTPEDVVNGALLVLQGHAELAADDFARTKAAIQEGLDQLERGEVDDWDPDEIRAEGRRLLEESRTDSKKKAI